MEWDTPGAPSVQDPLEGESFFRQKTEMDGGKNPIAHIQ